MSNNSELLRQEAGDRSRDADAHPQRTWVTPRIITSVVEDNTENGGGAATDTVVAS